MDEAPFEKTKRRESFVLFFWGGVYLFFKFYLFFYFFIIFFISWRLITLQYCSGFCHTLT